MKPAAEGDKRAGLQIFRALVVVLIAFIVIFSWACYADARTGNWFPAIVFPFVFWPATLCAVGALFVLAWYAVHLSGRPRWFGIILLLFVVAVGAPVGAHQIGWHRFQSELGQSQELANCVVREVEAYRKETGAYPETLDEITKPLPREVLVGGRSCDLHYERSDGQFRLSFSWWVYDPVTGEWYFD